MRAFSRQPEAGSIVLVALCMLAVLGIGLTAHLAVSQQASRLAHRNYADGLSRQLAEMGLERALWAFNRNDWSGWKIDGTTAYFTHTFQADKFGGNGIIGTFKVRLDDYHVTQLGASWSSGQTYVLGDLVGYNGIWYRCLTGHTGHASRQPPNRNFWAEEGTQWEWGIGLAYKTQDLVNRNGVWYRAKSNHNATAGNAPPNPTFWDTIDAFYTSAPWPYPSEGILHTNLGNNSGIDDWAQLRSPSTWNWAAPISWRWRDGVTYTFNDFVNYEGIWYRCTTTHTSTWSNEPIDNNSPWRRVESQWAWSSTENYKINDVVYRGGRWYRCLIAHSNQQPPNTTYWSDTPLATIAWSRTRSYAVNSIVSHGGTWYRCIQSHTDREPPNTTYWTPAPVIYVEGSAAIPGRQAVTTQLRATLGVASLFPNAVAASERVNFSSGTTGGLIDSYDATAGDYNQTSAPFSASSPNRTALATLAGGNASSNAVMFTQGTLQGYVAAPPAVTPPHNPQAAFGSGAIVRGGSTGSGVDNSRISRSPYIPRHSLQSVTGGTTLSVSSNSTTTIGTPGATTPSIYVINGNLDLNSGGLLRIIGPVVLNVKGRLYTNGGLIEISQTGSATIHFSGQLYVGSSTSSGIDNKTKDPKKLTLIGTSTANTSDSHYLWSRIPFYGTIYMPNAHLTIWNNVEIFGALSARNITFPYKPTLHYDTSLQHVHTSGTESPYLIREWRELLTDAERISF